VVQASLFIKYSLCARIAGGFLTAVEEEVFSGRANPFSEAAVKGLRACNLIGIVSAIRLESSTRFGFLRRRSLAR
jgi:hypothetical protein